MQCERSAGHRQGTDPADLRRVPTAGSPAPPPRSGVTRSAVWPAPRDTSAPAPPPPRVGGQGHEGSPTHHSTAPGNIPTENSAPNKNTNPVTQAGLGWSDHPRRPPGSRTALVAFGPLGALGAFRADPRPSGRLGGTWTRQRTAGRPPPRPRRPGPRWPPPLPTGTPRGAPAAGPTPPPRPGPSAAVGGPGRNAGLRPPPNRDGSDRSRHR